MIANHCFIQKTGIQTHRLENFIDIAWSITRISIIFRELLTKISKVTIEEMIAAAVKYMKPLIEPKTSVLSAICPPSKMMEIKVELER